MVFVDGRTMILHAYKNNYAIGAFSVHNMETAMAILNAAQAENAPVMIQIGQNVIQNIGMRNMKMMLDEMAKNYTIPVSIHLDHSREFAQVVKAIQLGFQSVMFDGSALPFAENTTITKKVVEIAKALDIGSEGEIGKIGGTEDDITVCEQDANITTVHEAKLFSNQTDVDYLAISIGTSHGVYREEPRIHFERLEEISKTIKKPIVLHGGSGVPDEQVKKSIQLGVAKINVDTELRQAFMEGIQTKLNEDKSNNIISDVLGCAREKTQQIVQQKIRLFGSDNKADLLDSN